MDIRNYIVRVQKLATLKSWINQELISTCLLKIFANDLLLKPFGRY